MQALRFFGPGNVILDDLPVPEIGPGEVLVGMRACGICGTDVKTYVRGHPKFPPGVVLGHEVAGEVVASQAPEVLVGQLVVAAPYAACGTCDLCLKGRPSLCRNLHQAYLDPGGLAELIRVPAGIVSRALLPLPPGMDIATATLTEPLACCVHGLEPLQVIPGRSLLILGDGPMALLQAALAKARGAGPLVLSGKIPVRLEFARRLVDRVVNVDQESLVEACREVLPEGADNVLVSVGSVEVAAQAFELIGKGGQINLFAGLPGGTQLPVDAYRLHYEEVQVTGTFGFGPEHFKQALALLVGGELDIGGLFTHTAPLAEARAALEIASQYQEIKSLVTGSAA